MIALPPEGRREFEAIINESKGEFRQPEVEKDVEKLRHYKERGDNKHKRGLRDLLVRAEVLAGSQQLRTLLIGVSFGVNSATKTPWNPGTVDFVFCVVNRERWRIGIFNRDLINIIAEMDGETAFPQCFVLGNLEYQNRLIF